MTAHLCLVPTLLFFHSHIVFHFEMHYTNWIKLGFEWHFNINILCFMWFEYSNRSRTRLTCTCPTCPFLWMSRSWRTSSNPSDRSSPHASSATATESAGEWASPGQWQSLHVKRCQLFLCADVSFSLYSYSGWSPQRNVMLWSLTSMGSSLNPPLECWVNKKTQRHIIVLSIGYL